MDTSTALRSGVKTSEFWLAVAGLIGTVAAIAAPISLPASAILATVSTVIPVAYAWIRGGVKKESLAAAGTAALSSIIEAIQSGKLKGDKLQAILNAINAAATAPGTVPDPNALTESEPDPAPLPVNVEQSKAAGQSGSDASRNAGPKKPQ